MPRQARESSGTGIYHVMMRGINHQSNHIHLLIREREDKIGMSIKRIPYYELTELVNDPLSDDVACIDIEDASKGRPSDDQVMMLIKEKTGVTNSSAFQQLPADTKKSVLIELKGRRASLRQLERLTGIGKSMIYRMG